MSAADRSIEALTADIFDDGPLDRHFGEFFRMKRHAYPYKLIGFDSEDNTKGTPICFAFYDGEKHFYTRHANEAIAYIYDYPEIAVFVGHNLEYDIGNLFKQCNFKYIETYKDNGKLLQVTLKFSKNFFINSSCFVPGKLERMGKIIGLPKLEGDVFDPAYVKRDAEITQVFMARLQQRVHEKWGVKLGITVGQLAMSTFRANYMTSEKQITYNSPNAMKAYYGGRVEIFYKGVMIGPINVSDINSCYPKVMRDYEYPDPAFMEKSRLDTHEFGFGRFRVRVPVNTFIPILPYRSETGRLFFPVGDFEGWWTYHEIRFCQTHIPGFKVLKEMWGEGSKFGCKPFTAFINDLYSERQNWKKVLEKNKNDPEANFESELLKLLMNNLYGKWCQQPERTIFTRYRMSKNEQEKMKVKKDGEEIYGCFFRYTLEDQMASTANYIWGIYVTSYARTYLYEQIKKIHDAGNTILYCDTDSIMYAGKNHVLELGSELGQLSNEKYDLAVFRQAKGYLLCDRSQDGEYVIEKSACKGVSTAHSLDFIIKGMAVSNKPMRLKEALVRTAAKVNRGKGEDFLRGVGVNIWRDVRKEMRSLYIKRKGPETGITQPINIEEISVLERNCSTEPASLETTLQEMGLKLRQKPEKPNYFANIVIPKDWFKKTRKYVGVDQWFSDRGMKWLKKSELSSLHPDDVWFRGEVMEICQGKFGEYIKLRLQAYMGEVCLSKNVYAAFPSNFLPNFQTIKNSLVKNVLEISLAEYYIENKPLQIVVEVTSKPQLRRKKCQTRKQQTSKKEKKCQKRKTKKSSCKSA